MGVVYGQLHSSMPSLVKFNIEVLLRFIERFSFNCTINNLGSNLGLWPILFLCVNQEQSVTKGQLISKCPYEKSVSSKIPTKIFVNFCPEIFCSFLGASW